MKWRKWAFAAITILLLGSLLYRFRFAVIFASFTPLIDFKSEDSPNPLDYRQPKSWALRPAAPNEASDKLRVFWIHPTTYRSPFHWNEDPADDGAAKRFEWTRERQASLFAECCLVFAPHYRQATLASYWKTGSGFQARALAFSDVKRAFEQFLAEAPADAPFVIAGHSQGAEHGLRLLLETVSGKELKNRLVAAYLIGLPIHRESLSQSMPDIPVCASPEQNSCLVGWSTFKESSNPENFLKQAVWPSESGYHSVSGDFVCVNPVSWLLDGKVTGPEQHRGARLKKNPGLKIKARCERSALLVDDVDPWLDLSLGGNYHLDDFALFYYDLENNVRTRRDAFLNAQKRL